jgi:uncharacterized protein YndB with AHSA1/START domain
MIKRIVVGLLVLVCVVLAYATTKPDSFSVERRISINAPPEKVFANINDFHAWEAWSPWAKLDPAMETTHSGAPSGTGAVYAWSGNSDVGSGRMEITGSTPSNNVTIKLDFNEPFESHNTTVFNIIPSATGSDVTWTMSGPSPYTSKVISVFMSMDKMIGGDFEKGLQQLKAVAEK